MFRYDRQPGRSEAIVVLLEHSSFAAPVALHRAIDSAGLKYGFAVVHADAGSLANRGSELIRHGILLADARAFDEVVELCEYHLKHLDTLSLAFNYVDGSTPESVKERIDLIKIKYSGRVNFIRPDISVDNHFAVSLQKIVDNAVCDTVRIKYFPERRQGSITDIPGFQVVAEFFRYASNVYAENSMYHRASSDGYFAMRAGDGFFITATKTDKIDLDPARISYVHSYSEKSGVLHYTGEYLPSSDSVECYIALEHLNAVRALVHTHASELFTRNSKFKEFVKVPRLPYGEPELGRSLAHALAADDRGFVIMDDHGEVFSLCDPWDLGSRVRDLKTYGANLPETV